MVLDAEVVAVDREKGNTLRSFQDLSTRPRGPVALHEVRLQPSCACSRVLACFKVASSQKGACSEINCY